MWGKVRLLHSVRLLSVEHSLYPKPMKIVISSQSTALAHPFKVDEFPFRWFRTTDLIADVICTFSNIFGKSVKLSNGVNLTTGSQLSCRCGRGGGGRRASRGSQQMYTYVRQFFVQYYCVCSLIICKEFRKELLGMQLNGIRSTLASVSGAVRFLDF